MILKFRKQNTELLKLLVITTHFSALVFFILIFPLPSLSPSILISPFMSFCLHSFLALFTPAKLEDKLSFT